jgi:hypothetical protein
MNKTFQTGTTKTGVALLMLGVALAGGSTINTGVVQAAPKAGTTMTAKLSGTFKQVTHATKGNASTTGRKLTLSNFETSMGPKLHVYLVHGNASSNDLVKKAVTDKKFTDLGALKNIKGTQSYIIPAGVNTKGASVVIWCDKFDVAFGSAALS